MRINYETCLVGTKCVLVPYRPQHVPAYHEWMKDPYLLHVTGSEPLTLEEEIQMQQSWKEDKEKCTFIVLAKDQCTFLEHEVEIQQQEQQRSEGDGIVEHNRDMSIVDPNFIERNLDAMIGDVNLFLTEEEEGDDGVDDGRDDDGVVVTYQSSNFTGQTGAVSPQKQAELDIMIAEKDYWGKGMGTEAARVMMLYGAERLNIRRFFVKIKEDNVASRTLFEKRLGFIECNYAECFKEVELEFKRKSAQEMADAVRRCLDGINIWTLSCPEDTLRISTDSKGKRLRN